MSHEDLEWGSGMSVANELAENQPGNIKPLLDASQWQRFLNNYDVSVKSSKRSSTEPCLVKISIQRVVCPERASSCSMD